VLADKTGSLIATSGRVRRDALRRRRATVDVLPGSASGSAWRSSSADDLLDVESETTESGKTPGTDLREGVADPAGAPRAAFDRSCRRPLRELLSRPLPDDVEHAEALALLRVHPAIEAARSDLRKWADDARSVLAPLPEVPAKAALTRLCDVVVERSS
jgi:heptaprenyl diphosphate synthase